MMNFLKKMFIFLIIICSTTSCVAATETPQYIDDMYYSNYSERISYTHEYYFNGAYYPVVYINYIPWYYYNHCWYTVPTSNYYLIYNRYRTMYYDVQEISRETMDLKDELEFNEEERNEVEERLDLIFDLKIHSI